MLLTNNADVPKVKICGLRDPLHGQLAVEYGADAIGMMFHQPSPRYLTIDEACRLSAVVGNKATRVGVFVNPSRQFVEEILTTVELDMLQFHGDESNLECQRWGLPWIKAVRVDAPVTVEQLVEHWPDASAILLDAGCGNAYGGTGKCFDWRFFPDKGSHSAGERSVPLILAGGLTPDNIQEAIVQLRPYAVDVSSGVEKQKGIKDASLIRRFLQEINHVRQTQRK